MTDGLVIACPHCGARNRVPFARLAERAQCGGCHRTLREPGSELLADDYETFTALVQRAPVPVLVDFWAPWCGPCKAVAPEIARVAARHAGSLLVARVNTDVDPRIGQRQGIASIPTMVVFARGRELGRTSGARPAAAIEAFVREAVAKAAS